MNALAVIKNKYIQAVALGLLTVLVLGANAHAYKVCIPGIPNYCIFTAYDRPYNPGGTDDIETSATVTCKGTNRVALVHKLQKKNTFGIWIDVESKTSAGTTYAAVNIDKDTSNSKTTTWRSYSTVVGNYGQWSWSHASYTSTWDLGT